MQRFRTWLERGVTPGLPAPRWLSASMETCAKPLKPRHNEVIEDELRAGLLETIMPGWLRNEDRMGMAWSIEARSPFLDVELIEFLGQVDYRLKIRGLSTKYLLRAAMKGIMPQRPRQRTDKMGLPTPMALWMRTTDRDSVRDYLDHAGRRYPDFFDGKGLGELFERHQAGADHSRAIYLALTTSLWMDEVAASASALVAAA